jgi:hypothetical protein
MKRIILATVVAFAFLAALAPTVSFAQGAGWSPDTGYSGDFQMQGR